MMVTKANSRNYFSGRDQASVTLLVRFPNETASDYLDRCYAHDHRFHGGRIGGVDKVRFRN